MDTRTQKQTTIENAFQFYDKTESAVNILAYGTDLKERGLFEGHNIFLTNFHTNTTDLFSEALLGAETIQ